MFTVFTNKHCSNFSGCWVASLFTMFFSHIMLTTRYWLNCDCCTSLFIESTNCIMNSLWLLTQFLQNYVYNIFMVSKCDIHGLPKTTYNNNLNIKSHKYHLLSSSYQFQSQYLKPSYYQRHFQKTWLSVMQQ